MSIVDARGRIGDRTVVRALGWRPGDPVRIRVVDDMIIVTADDGSLNVSAQGRVHLPAEVRHVCAIAAGDPVLLAAEPASGELSVYPPARLDSLPDTASTMLVGAS